MMLKRMAGYPIILTIRAVIFLDFILDVSVSALIAGTSAILEKL